MKRFILELWGSRSGRIGMIITWVVLIAALAAPVLSSADPAAQDTAMIGKPPSFEHPLGTDLFGRDMLSRILHGGRVSIGIGLGAALIAMTLGTLVGMTAGFAGGWTDTLLMRLVDVLLGFPRLFVVLLAVGFASPSMMLTMTVLGALSWMDVARVVRGEVMVIRETSYLRASIALGLKRSRIFIRHILPNVAGPIIVSATLLIGTMILVEASISFLGLGVQPPDASWGIILNHGSADPVGAWWISTFAGLAIVVTVIGFNLLGDAIRDVVDPRTG